MKFLQALGYSAGLLLIMFLVAPLRSFVFRTDLKKDIKFIVIFWIILTVALLISLVVHDLRG